MKHNKPLVLFIHQSIQVFLPSYAKPMQTIKVQLLNSYLSSVKTCLNLIAKISFKMSLFPNSWMRIDDNSLSLGIVKVNVRKNFFEPERILPALAISIPWDIVRWRETCKSQKRPWFWPRSADFAKNPSCPFPSFSASSSRIWWADLESIRNSISDFHVALLGSRTGFRPKLFSSKLSAEVGYLTAGRPSWWAVLRPKNNFKLTVVSNSCIVTVEK